MIEARQSANPARVEPSGPNLFMDPSAQDNREGRIRAALGLALGHLPKVERRWLHCYYEHLAAKLSIPFTAQYTGEGGCSRPILVTVVALLDPEEASGHEADGLVCAAHEGSQQRDLPLVDIEVEADHPNYQLLDDYWYWFWNWRFDPRI